MLTSPTDLARRQMELDGERTKRFPFLLALKTEKMRASPLAFLRGAGPLFYELLGASPALAAGPPGEGWIAGDLHVENFGAFKTDPSSTADAEGRVVFDINDFDDAVVGPWRLDVLRLATSLLLGLRHQGVPHTEANDLVLELLAAHQAALLGAKRAPAPPGIVTRFMEKVAKRNQADLVDERTEDVRGARRFTRGKRYRSLPGLVRAAAVAMARYEKTSPAKTSQEAFETVDAAFRVMGSGSLGRLHVAVLVRDPGGRHRIYDVKEPGTPSPGRLLKVPRTDPGLRVVTAIRACLARPPMLLGASKLGEIPVVVRRLAPQEDKIDFSTVPPAEYPAWVRHAGFLVGCAHRRGASAPPRKAWSSTDRAEMLERAILLAGFHEAAYLAYCRLRRR